jgi:nucleotide-binding universal stress UspA family protein
LSRDLRSASRHGEGDDRARRPADALAVADELTVSETLVRIAEDVDAAAIVVGRHDHSALHDVLVGSTAKGLLRQAPCPVLVVRSADAVEVE